MYLKRFMWADLWGLNSKSKAKDQEKRLTGYSGNRMFFICAVAYGMQKKLEGDKVWKPCWSLQCQGVCISYGVKKKCFQPRYNIISTSITEIHRVEMLRLNLAYVFPGSTWTVLQTFNLYLENFVLVVVDCNKFVL